MLGDPAKLCQNAGNPVGKPADMDLTGLVIEKKWDGFRLLAYAGPNGVETYTRSGKSQRGKLPHIEAALHALPEGTWLDGEIVAIDAHGMNDWGKVQSKMGSNAGDPQGTLTYVVFACLSYGPLDIRPLPLSDRRTAIETILPTVNSTRIVLGEQHPASHAIHDQYIADGFEGSIIKDPTKPYASGKRGQGWTKFKANDEMDVVIMGYKPGKNSFIGMVGAIEFGQYQAQDWCSTCKDDPAGQRWLCPDVANHPKVLTYRGQCSGMDMKKRQEISADEAGFMGQVISVAYMGIMPSGSPRHPQYRRFRTDKLPTDCDWTTS